MVRVSANELSLELAHFTVSETIYAHALNRGVRYTEGVRHFARLAGAYWFLDILATEPAILRQAREFASIILAVNGGGAKISVTDGNERTVFSRVVEYTDCPEGEWRFYFCNQTILLPSEY